MDFARTRLVLVKGAGQDILIYVKKVQVTKVLRNAGIDRHDLLVYHCENYLIRCQGVFDRALALVDAVFHLLNAPTQMKDHVVLHNLRVARTGVPKKIASLRSILTPHQKTRNEVTHQRTFQTDDLRRLEMYGLLLASVETQSYFPHEKRVNLEEVRQEEEEWIVMTQTHQFSALNLALGRAVRELFGELAPHFADQELRLKSALGKP